MMKPITAAFFIFLFQCSAPASAQQAGVWPVVEKQMKPWTRWWWMGNAVDKDNLNQVLTQYQQAGFGGVEITPIYGAQGFENRYIDFLSPKWMEMLQHTVQKSTALGVGVDMNTGTGWPFGGPQVTIANAASKLIVQQYELAAGRQLNEPIKVKEVRQESAVLQALTAYGSDGTTLDLLTKVEASGRLNWTAGKGSWKIYAAFAGKTNQQVKRAAPGGQGLTLDHLDKTAVDAYLKRFDDAFAGKIPGIRSFFNDSYEVYGANWTPTFFAEFKKRRGYDLRKYLRELTEKDGGTETVARVKSDYRETMSELLCSNFTGSWTKWAHKYGAYTRNQSHGSPGNLLDLYGIVDIPETETFGSSHFPVKGIRRDSADVQNVDPDPIMSKFAASAAHTGGKTLVSSETFTWLTEHFKTSWSQCKPEAEQLFLAGVNHLVYHGTAYSPDDAAWPGWLFYASAEFNPNNSLWPHINGLNTYVTRCQSVLQSGRADNELLIYWPVYDVWNNAKGMDMPIKVHNIHQWLQPTPFYQLSKKLSGMGYAADFASDHLLQQTVVKNGKISTAPQAPAYRVLIIPHCQLISLVTLQKVIRLASEGATIIFQQLPQDVPGLARLQQRKMQLQNTLAKLAFKAAGNGVQQYKRGKGCILLAADVEKALALCQLQPEELSQTGLQFIRRSIAGGKYYYLVNHTAKDLDSQIPFNAPGKALIMDPQSGTYGLATAANRAGKLMVRMQIKSGEALILKITENMPAGMPDWLYLNQPATAITLNNAWDLNFTAGGPALPAAQKLSKLIPWTSLPDPKLQVFSGTGVYSSNFDLPLQSAKEYLLNLNQVAESARVWINGREVGIFWSVPFQTRIGQYLKTGQNTIKVEVVNLMANRIRYMDQQKIQWLNYHEINFVNINYKPFDAANWAVMPSGLIGPVSITPYF